MATQCRITRLVLILGLALFLVPTSQTQKEKPSVRIVGRLVTLSLLRPDGQVVVVSCNSDWTDWNTPLMNGNCRLPLTNTVEAEFDGDKAKLEWSDGKKKQNETYKILHPTP